MLDGDVVRFVTQFYIYLKALQDALERGAEPESAAWRESALTVIYSAFRFRKRPPGDHGAVGLIARTQAIRADHTP